MAEEASSPGVDEVVDRYRATLEALDEGGPSPNALLAALLDRDRVADVLDAARGLPERVQRVAGLDGRLRHLAALTRTADWNGWRQAIGVAPDRWWWWLDEAQGRESRIRNTPWLFAAGLLMTATLGLGADISLKLWGSGAGALSVLSGTLTLLFTSGPLTTRGRELAGWLIERLRLPIRFRAGTMVIASLLFFVLALLLRLVALPAWARGYNDRGVEWLAAGDLAEAQRALDRAVSIDPQYAQGYYNLGAAYLGVGDYDRAVTLFRQSLAADRNLDVAYSGLGYALTELGSPEKAIPVLYGGLAVAQDVTAKGALYTNLGRAFLAAGRLLEAESALQEALGLDGRDAAAHCALAQVAEQAGWAVADVRARWEECLSYADPTTPRGLELAGMARAHLQNLDRGE